MKMSVWSNTVFFCSHSAVFSVGVLLKFGEIPGLKWENSLSLALGRQNKEAIELAPIKADMTPTSRIREVLIFGELFFPVGYFLHNLTDPSFEQYQCV